MTNYSSVRYASSGTTVYADMNALIAATGSDGAQAFVQSNNNIYVYAGTGWYKIATVQNDSPSAITGVAGSYSLAIDGTPTVITAVSTDPEGFPLTWTYSTSGLGSIATVSQADNVFTITPSTDSANEGTFTLTLNATDGVNGAVSTNTVISLQFYIANSNYTTLLATAVDTSTNSVITDSSVNNHTITVTGDAHSGTFSPYRHGGYSTYFDGSGDYLSIASNAAFGFGTGDFTIEFWTYWGGTLNSGNGGTFLGFRSAVAAEATVVYLSTLGEISFYDGPSNVEVGSGVTITQEWTHIAVTRESGLWRIFVNGTLGATRTSSSDLGSSKPCLIGQAVNGTTTSYNGYISDVRIIKGTAVYTSNFTPPTERLTTVTNTSLLTCHLPYISDGSSSAHSITVNGNTSTQPFSPYDNPEYSVADNGGSIYFDGTGDLLTITNDAALDFGTGDFTIEAWVYNTGTDYFSIWQNAPVLTTTDTSRAFLGIQSSNDSVSFSRHAGGGSLVTSANVAPKNQWNHIVLVRDSTSVRIYVNGVEEASTTDTTLTSYGFGQHTITVGYRVTPNYGQGYISDLKTVKGTALYTANFTPPTLPLTATSGTGLLLSGTDASIIDKSQTSNIRLAGNTTGSTTQVKFADTKSMYFDGTGDYAIIEADAANFGTGDFTIEMWLYPTGTGKGIFRKTTSTGSASPPSLSVYVSGTTPLVGVNSGTADGSWITASSGFSNNAWNHFAITRNSGTVTIWINGNSAGSATRNVDVDNNITFRLGEWRNATEYYTGYIQDFRLTKGLARYTANFTPSTEPLKG